MNSNEIQQIKSFVEDLDKCEICFESSHPSLILVDCGHSLCCQCLTDWLKHGNKTCPFCREKIKSVPIRFPTKLANLKVEAGKILGYEANNTNVLLTSQLEEIRKLVSPHPLGWSDPSFSSSFYPESDDDDDRSEFGWDDEVSFDTSPVSISSSAPILTSYVTPPSWSSYVPPPPLPSISSPSRPLILVSLPNQGWTNIEDRCSDEEDVMEMEVTEEVTEDVSFEKKQLGESLFPLVHQQNPRLAHRITCLLLDQMRIHKIKELLLCPGILTWKIGKAIDDLRAQGMD